MLRAASRRAIRPSTTSASPFSRPRIPAAASESPLLPFLYPPTCTNILHSLRQEYSSAPSPRRNYSSAPETSINNHRFQLLSGEWVGGDGSRPPPSIAKPAKSEKPSLLILDTPKQVHVASRGRHDRFGIAKDHDELLATYEACIRVGRIARAQIMLNEITRILANHSGLLVTAHNSFLQALLKRAQAENTEDNIRALFSWYEDTMVRKFNISADATTMAILFAASLRLDQKLLGQRHIQKWAEEWKGTGNEPKAILEVGVLAPEDAVKVSRILKIDQSELSEELQQLIAEIEPEQRPAILDVPEAQASVVKGLSLAAVRQSLKSLIDPDAMPSPYAYADSDAGFQIARQKLLEEDAYTSAMEVWKKDHESMKQQGIAQISGNINAVLWQWHQSMVPLLRQELDRVTHAENSPTTITASDRLVYGPYLRLLTPEKVAATTILEMIKLQNSTVVGEGIKSSTGVIHLGSTLEQEYYAQEISKKKNREIFGNINRENLQEILSNPRRFRMEFRKREKRLQETPTANVDMMITWPAEVKAKLGAVLISMMIHCALTPVSKRDKQGQLVTQYAAAFYHSYEYIKGRRVGVIKMHPDLVRRMAEEPLRRGVFGRLLPMLVPPRPWHAYDQGAYYYSRSRMMRTKFSKEQEIYIQAASQRGDLEEVFEGLDVLGQTAWKINRRVFDTVLEVWNNGDEFADIPARDFTKDFPHEPAPGADARERMRWLNEMREIKLEQQNAHSQRCSVNLKLEIARAFLFEKFYFPHNVDFRGRAYPIPPNLNHLGDDLSRGLLMFYKGKPLGENGLRWLKIHLANIAGNDKASFTDREKFVDEHLDDIFDSADNPLKGRKWWLKAEDPWQCLAASIALTEAMRMDDPREYICHFPVAQDGTCNGLQHYAALGGDEAGAKQVNLEPSDKPQDVYTGVADLVNAQVDIDFEAGHELALLVKGHVLRKVVKQSVMTNVYGVTFIGARQQIQNQLEGNPAIPKEKVTACASYLAKLVFASISTMFGGATKIQHWLADAARIISRSAGPSQARLYGEDGGLQVKLIGDDSASKTVKNAKKANETAQPQIEFMSSVIWTTPLGMPIVQPYRDNNPRQIQTNLQKVQITDPNAIEQVNSRKQMTAFPPNFIHSLDATHMLLSATKAAENALTFASVHDSFWCHPSDVDKLNLILRDAFIKIHSEDIMQRLKKEFEQRYQGYFYVTKIESQHPTSKAIRELRMKYAKEVLKKKSTTLFEDFQWEVARAELLKSPDEELRKRGEKMITPSVLVERAGGLAAMEMKEAPTEGLGEALADEELEDFVAGSDVSRAKKNLGIFDADEDGGADDIDLAAEEMPDEDDELDLLEALENEEIEADEDADVEEKPKKRAAKKTKAKKEETLEKEEMEEMKEIEEAEELDAEANVEGEVPEKVDGRKRGTFGDVRPKRESRPMRKTVTTMHIWMPLKFPDLPPKGNFDVARLKYSDYFFS